MALEQQQGKDSLLVLVTEKSGGRIRIGSHVLTRLGSVQNRKRPPALAGGPLRRRR